MLIYTKVETLNTFFSKPCFWKRWPLLLENRLTELLFIRQASLICQNALLDRRISIFIQILFLSTKTDDFYAENRNLSLTGHHFVKNSISKKSYDQTAEKLILIGRNTHNAEKKHEKNTRFSLLWLRLTR